jgi:hypothetical protein
MIYKIFIIKKNQGTNNTKTINMEFFIQKDATLPILYLELIQDGRNDFNKFFELIQNADIYFDMTNITTGIKKIGKKLTGVSLVEPISCIGEEYYLKYQFSERDTNTAGKYLGQFTIKFLDGSGTLIVPIREQLFINILDGDIKK